MRLIIKRLKWISFTAERISDSSENRTRDRLISRTAFKKWSTGSPIVEKRGWHLVILYFIILCSLVYPITLRGRWPPQKTFLPFFLVMSSAVLNELAKSLPGHYLILSSLLFFCLHYLLFPFNVPCRIVLAKPEDFGMCPTSSVSVSWPRSGAYHIF